MPALEKPDSPLTTTAKWRFPSIHPEGRKYAVGVGAIALFAFLLHWDILAWLLVGLTIWVATFFRDPMRTTPRGDRLIVAPADGLITMIAKVPPPPELRGSDALAEGEYTRVSIFMSVFDVHINRAPISGRVRRIAYVPGKFINADLDKASEDNERQHLLIEGADGLRIGFTQIAGLVARRILAFVKEGDTVDAGAARGADPLREPRRRLSAGGHRPARLARPALDRRRDGARRNRDRPGADGHQPVIDVPETRGIAFRALVPNAVTALALCFGLSGVRFAVSAAQGNDSHWEIALACVVGAGVLDGMDGRIARLLRAQSRFGAELDSLSDVCAFGVAPALIMFLWSLHAAPQFGWTASLALAVCCALRLARFNSRIDSQEQPHKSAGFLTEVPAPAGAGLAFVPVYLWLVTGSDWFRTWFVTMPWVLLVALLMLSSVATYSWSSLRIRQSSRLPTIAGIGLLGAALLTAPWLTLLGVSILYLAMIPFSLASYGRVKRRRASAARRA